MNEYPPNSSELDDSSEAKIEHLMDTLGISHREAQDILGLGEGPARGSSAAESRRLHPSRHVPTPARKYRRYESRYDGEAFPFIDNSDLSDEHIKLNSQRAELAKRALHANDPPQTAEDIARARAKKERQARNY